MIDQVLARLGAGRVSPDLAGLNELYARWCAAVPFDNVRKLVHLAEEVAGPLPGSSSADFFAAWLATGAGGTCWAGNGALHDLLAALGFSVQRAAATMMAAPDTPPSNHGSVVVTIDGARYITDASILSVVALRIPVAGDPPSTLLPRAELRGDQLFVVWRSQRAPTGFDCRFDRIGISADELDDLHQRTRAWGPFNYAVSARVVRDGISVGYGLGQRYTLDAAGTLDAEPVVRAGRDRVLVERIGIDAALVARLPDDRPLPPRPG